MERRLSLLCGLLLSVGILSRSEGAVPKRVVCYYLSWTFGYKHPYNYEARDIPTGMCSDVIYAFLTMDHETWELNSPQQDSDMQRQLLAFSSAASPSGPRLLVGVGGALDDGAKWAAMVADPSKRSSFVTSALRLLREHGFHGMDLYWSSPEEADRENYVKLVEELSAAFRPSGYLLTATVNLVGIVLSYNDTPSGYDVQRLSELLDWINVKTYYMRGPWNDFADVHSPLYRRQFELGKTKYLNAHDGMEILGQLGAPRHKLMMGVPFFGTSYTLLSGSDHRPGSPANKSAAGGAPGPVTDTVGFLAYYEICRGVASGRWQRRFDHEAKCPYAYRGDQWVGYEDEQSIRIKMEFVKNRGYGGAYVWAVNLDDFNGFCGSVNPLLNAVHQALSQPQPGPAPDGPELMLRKRYEAMGILPQCKC